MLVLASIDCETVVGGGSRNIMGAASSGSIPPTVCGYLAQVRRGEKIQAGLPDPGLPDPVFAPKFYELSKTKDRREIRFVLQHARKIRCQGKQNESVVLPTL